MNEPNRRNHSLRPIVIDATAAHRSGAIGYHANGTVTLAHPSHELLSLPKKLEITAERQFPAIRATFDDLNKPLSRLANSPLVDGGCSLRQAYEEEVERYNSLVNEAQAAGGFEPDYGNYVYDRLAGNLYLLAPERWHRLALVTSNSKVLTDPGGVLSWSAMRSRLENAVIGFAGVSVGSNVLEGWLREARPKCIKVADPDWVELTNLNRGERFSLRHLVGSRARRFDLRNSYDTERVSKAEAVVYEQQLVDPYLDAYVYTDGLTQANMKRFLEGDGDSEPAIDILVEEMDDLDLKIEVRERARSLRLDVLMVSDLGNSAHVLWNPYSSSPGASLGYHEQDEDLLRALDQLKAGDRSKLTQFLELMCGKGCITGSFGAFLRGEGEQPTSSMPQSGSTAMASGAIGGKELAMHVLGHGLPQQNRVIYDFETRFGAQG